MLRPELEQVEGFIDNIRYKSLNREGWILSLSGWRDEKSVVRWRTAQRHHMVQEKGAPDFARLPSERRTDHARHAGAGRPDNQEQRLDETEIGDRHHDDIDNPDMTGRGSETSNSAGMREYLGLGPRLQGILDWDVFEAVLTPGDIILMMSGNRRKTPRLSSRRVMLPPDGAVAACSCHQGLRHVRSARGSSVLRSRRALAGGLIALRQLP